MNKGGSFVLGKVVAVRDPGSCFYHSCNICLSRTYFDANGWHCMKCGNDQADVQCRYRVRFGIFDGLYIYDVTVFGQLLDSYFGCSAFDLEQKMLQSCGVFSEDRVRTAVNDTFIGEMFWFRLSGRADSADVTAQLMLPVTWSTNTFSFSPVVTRLTSTLDECCCEEAPEVFNCMPNGSSILCTQPRHSFDFDELLSMSLDSPDVASEHQQHVDSSCSLLSNSSTPDASKASEQCNCRESCDLTGTSDVAYLSSEDLFGDYSSIKCRQQSAVDSRAAQCDITETTPVSPTETFTLDSSNICVICCRVVCCCGVDSAEMPAVCSSTQHEIDKLCDVVSEFMISYDGFSDSQLNCSDSNDSCCTHLICCSTPARDVNVPFTFR